MKTINLAYSLLVLFVIGSSGSLYAQESHDWQKWYPYEGTYDFGNGERVTLGIFDEFNHSLVYLNLQTLKLGALLPITETTFKDNNDSTLVFQWDASKLQIIKNGRTVTGKKIMLHTRETIRFNSGDNTLEGDLYLPAAKGKHPVVVFAHGSGPTTRGVSFFTTYFLQLGIGVFTFDKQGAGKSQGDWETAGLTALADDVVAAVNTVKTNPKADASKIGILGNSQGGWVGSIAASKSKDVAYLLMRVGSGQNVLETIAHEYEGSFLAEGFTKEETAEIVQMYRRHWLLAAQGKTWEEGNNVLLSHQDRSWFPKVFPTPRVKTETSEKWWIWLSKNLYSDSYDYLKQLQIPVLWQLAEKDWNVNTQKSEPRIIEALTKAGNKDFLVKTHPHMGHSGLLVKTGLPNDALSWQYAPGFWETMTTWLQQHKIAE